MAMALTMVKRVERVADNVLVGTVCGVLATSKFVGCGVLVLVAVITASDLGSSSAVLLFVKSLFMTLVEWFRVLVLHFVHHIVS